MARGIEDGVHGGLANILGQRALIENCETKQRQNRARQAVLDLPASDNRSTAFNRLIQIRSNSSRTILARISVIRGDRKFGT
ncbi:hypothetical protein ASF24_22715 [Methylobacterium sp. Leaf86]|nr:hypothetical protein ASF24_22715 [Methylobacterium sp. Leaf86]